MSGELNSAGWKLVAISTDAPSASALLAGEHFLPFPLLSDPDRRVIEAYGVLDQSERDGIATPAIFAVDRMGDVSFRSVDSMTWQLDPKQLLAALNGARQGAAKRLIWLPKLLSVLRRSLNLTRASHRGQQGGDH